MQSAVEWIGTLVANSCHAVEEDAKCDWLPESLWVNDKTHASLERWA